MSEAKRESRYGPYLPKPGQAKNWYSHNIDAPIIREASIYGKLYPLATGGGCDFVIRPVVNRENEWVCDLVLSDMYGESPATLEEEAEVVLYIDEEWIEGIKFYFSTVKKAIRWMGKVSSVN